MSVSDFVVILAALSLFMAVFPPVALAGACIGLLMRHKFAVIIGGAIAGALALYASVAIGRFQLEMGRFPSRGGIWAYFSAAAVSGAAWAFCVRTFSNWRAQSGEQS